MKTCIHCDEEIAPDEPLAPLLNNCQFAHWACGVRMVVGGLNHINGTCSCCGGDLPPDPEGVTKREAAMMAAQAWITRNQRFLRVAKKKAKGE